MDRNIIFGKTIIDEGVAKIGSFKELTSFFLKNSFHYTKILESIILIIIVFFGIISQVPYYYAFSTIENISLFVISAMIYGSTFYAFRKSTIFENMKETNLSKKEIYLSIFIVMFLFTGLMYLFSIALFSLCIFVDSPLLINDWFFTSDGVGEGGLFLNQLNIQLLFWWYFAFILLNFGLFYLFQNIANTKKSFFIFIFLYLVMLIIWGNASNPPNLGTNYDNLFSNYSEIIDILHFKDIEEINGLSNDEIKIILRHYNVSSDITIKSNILKKWENGRYISALGSAIVPHSWINIFCASVWRGTALKSGVISFGPTDNPITITLSYQNSFLKNQSIWKIRDQVWWALSMYLWILYFLFLYLFGSLFSRIKNK